VTLTAREARVAHLAATAFAASSGPERIGAEVELIPVERSTRRIAAIDADDRPSTLRALRAAAHDAAWTERRSPKSGMPEFLTPGGGRITFEPGGQLEYASPPMESISALLADLRDVMDRTGESLDVHGLEAVHLGMDPANPIESVPLQAAAARYHRMDAHFASIGPHGARMMRQTASIQINVDGGEQYLERWRLLNAIAPYLAAIFANAPAYAGQVGPDASLRRVAWNRLDPLRTGLPFDAVDPLGCYADFAWRAPHLLGTEPDPPFPSFCAGAAWQGETAVWEAHLTTLFPEIRPRGYFEVRSIDAIDPRWYAAPLILVAGLTLADGTAAAAREITGNPDPSLLEAAGWRGIADPRLAAGALALAELALRGAESLGSHRVRPADLAAVDGFLGRFTRVGRMPADEVRDALSGTRDAASSLLRRERAPA